MTSNMMKPNFSTPVAVDPAKINHFFSRFELAQLTFSELEPISLDKGNGHTFSGIRVGNDAFFISPRFLKSLMTMFEFTENIFGYFSPGELFERIIQRPKNQPVQLCFDQKEKIAMAVTKGNNQAFPLARVVNAVQQNDNLIAANYKPKSGLLEVIIDQPNEWKSSNDSEYRGRLRFSTPVDCWGDSRIALGTFRQICANGAIISKDVYSSKVILEKNQGTHLQHLLTTFRNDRAFVAMQKRLSDARNIQVSAAEYWKANQLFMLYGGDKAQQIAARLEEFAGYPEQYYQCDSIERLPPARRKDLPVNLSLLNLLNMVSEVITHHQQEDVSDLEKFYSSLMTQPSDLEGVYSIRQPVKKKFFDALPLEA